MRIRSSAGYLIIGALLAAAPAASAVLAPARGVAPSAQRSMARTLVSRAAFVPVHRGAIPDKAGVATVFVSDAGSNTVDGYLTTGGSPTFIASTGISEPQGLAASRKNLYVANTGDSNILAYRPPSTTPTLTFAVAGEYPTGVAVTPTGSQIWVSNICSLPSCGEGNLQEYTSSGQLEQTIVCGNIYRYYFVAVDAAGDVAVDGQSSSGNASVDVLPARQTSCSTTTISLSFAGGLAFTKNGDLAVLDQDSDGITVYAKPAFRKVVRTVALEGGGDDVTFAFQGKDTSLWSAGTNGLDEFAWPAGGYPIFTIGGAVEPVGVAVLPSAKT